MELESHVAAADLDLSVSPVEIDGDRILSLRCGLSACQPCGQHQGESPRGALHVILSAR